MMVVDALGEVLPEAVGIAISPIPVVFVILMLVSARAKTNGPAFLVGWYVGLLVVTGIAYAVADAADASTSSTGSDGTHGVQIVLGAVLVVLAFRQLRNRPKPGEPEQTPRLFQAVDKVKAPAAFGLGALLSGVNPKNLLLGISAGIGIAQAGATGSSGVVAVALFAVLASVTVAAPVVIALVMGPKAERILGSWREWLMHNNATVMFVLFLVIGAKVLGQGLGLFG
jgi:hypothetical protein